MYLRFTALLLVLGISFTSVPADDPPKSIGLTERTRADIALVQVMVDGPRNLIRTLTKDDFSVIVDGRPVTLVAADSQCGIGADEIPADGPQPALARAPTSYLFYFDQHNLTLLGRENSIDIAKEMVAEFVRDGNRAAIVSAGQELVTFADFTSDGDLLAEALERLREDRKQFDEYASLELNRQHEVWRAARRSDAAGCLRASIYQREETVRTESALERFSAVLGRFINEDPPKIAVYFGDTLRVESGRHYGCLVCGCDLGGFDALGAFESLKEDAAAFGVRIYAVQAAGLTNNVAWGLRSASRLAEQHAVDGLKALTLDTGGDAFLGGASAKKMIRRIRDDSDCLYLLSFDPGAYPKDRPLPVRVEVHRDKVEAHSRSQLLFLSDAARKTAALLAAFVSPESVKDRLPMTGAVVPLELLKNGRFRALVQLTVPGSALPIAAEWDLGMSLVFGRATRAEASGRVAVDRAGIPIVLEAEMNFRPGAYEVRLVGQETRSGLIGAGKITGEWPRFEGGPAITEIALLQPSTGAFLRGDESRTRGSLAVAADRAVNPELPTAFLSLVCSAGRGRKPLIVKRALSGEGVVELEPMELTLENDSCAQIQDMIPAGTMMPGLFTYSVRVDGSQAARTREFVVSAPGGGRTSR